MSDSGLIPTPKQSIDKRSDVPDIVIGGRYIDSRGHIVIVTGIDFEHKRVQWRSLHYGNMTSGSDFHYFIKAEKAKHPEYMLMPDGEDYNALMVNPSLVMPDEPATATTTALGLRTSERQIVAFREKMQVIADRTELVKRVMEIKRAELSRISSLMHARIAYMDRILQAMENYLGIYEKIIMIRDGEPAPLETPIHFMQAVLWMDEEVGDVELRSGQTIGIDFASIDVFDRWVATGDNAQKIVPYPKCVVALQPSRQVRDYGDPMVTAMLGKENKAIYLLIRNGDRLYRICTAISYGDTLYPTQDTWEKIASAQAQAEEREDEENLLRAKTDEFEWIKRIALLQGLLDRTDVFDPKPMGLEMMNPEAYDTGALVLVRDFEFMRLPTGRPSFKEWHKALMDGLKVGSRIIIAGLYGRHDADRFDGRFYAGRSTPDGPKNGVYTVEEIRKERYDGIGYRILYAPDRWWKWDDDESDNPVRRLSFWVKAYDQVLPYDGVSLEDVEYYIGLRAERRRYTEILPMLYTIYRVRTQEKAWEAEFVQAMASRLGVAEAVVWKAVDWWKMKVKAKRPITKDEAKAWRMIEKRVKKGETLL